MLDWEFVDEEKPKTVEPPPDWLDSMLKPIGDYYYDSDMTDTDIDENFTVCDPSHLTEGRFSLFKGITPLNSPGKSEIALPFPGAPQFVDDEDFSFSAGEQEMNKINLNLFNAIANLALSGLKSMRDSMYSSSGSILKMLKVRSPQEEKEQSVKEGNLYLRDKEPDVPECRNQQIWTDLDIDEIYSAIEELYDNEYDRQYFKMYNSDKFYIAVACSMRFFLTKVVENDKIIFELRHGREDYHHVLLYLTKESDTVALWYTRNWYALKFIVNGEGIRKCMKAFVFNDIKVGSIVSTMSGDGNIIKIRISGLQRYRICKHTCAGEYKIFSTPLDFPENRMGQINTITDGSKTVYAFDLFPLIRPPTSVFLILSTVALLDRLKDDPKSTSS